MDPIGFISAELQSYLVKYPLRPSSKLADPTTNKNPCFYIFQGIKPPIKYAKIILDLAYIF